ncbi:40-kDa huntingtin-associated protein-like [Ailuropoda melanoleuca]|uniref:40-kDa huntingtin-associated protein-like n=1 Tax=Ailuropoda melanoleuca TaxID=9646 RepID=UPI00149459BC|nr:40-kDa huntingtin-associated protein-like [Ailuropoda melanoleuca]
MAASAAGLGGGPGPGPEAGDFLARYRQVSNKLKKRFLRKPNVAEAGEQFGQLGRELRAQECLPYAAWCQLAVARCQQALFHGPGEALALTEAARLFLRQERDARQRLAKLACFLIAGPRPPAPPPSLLNLPVEAPAPLDSVYQRVCPPLRPAPGLPLSVRPHHDATVTVLSSGPRNTIPPGPVPGSHLLRANAGVFCAPASPPAQPAPPTQGHPLQRPREKLLFSVLPDSDRSPHRRRTPPPPPPLRRSNERGAPQPRPTQSD